MLAIESCHGNYLRRHLTMPVLVEAYPIAVVGRRRANHMELNF